MIPSVVLRQYVKVFFGEHGLELCNVGKQQGGSSKCLLTVPGVRATGHKTPGESSEIRMRLLEGYSTLYTSSNVRVSRIGAKLVCSSITSKQAKVAPEGCHAVQG